MSIVFYLYGNIDIDILLIIYSGTPGERGPFGPQGVQGFPGSIGPVGKISSNILSINRSIFVSFYALNK